MIFSARSFRLYYEKEFANVVVIGDANKGGRIHNATKDGFTKAYAFDM